MIRINKYLSLCGVSSRRGAENLIAEGKVTINDEMLTKVGTMIDEENDAVKVNGALVAPVTQKVSVVLNKPRMVMTTLFDPFKRRTVKQCLKGLEARVYPVGRLDYDTQGVLLLTNDGDLAYRLAHPRFKVQRIYEARVEGQFEPRSGLKISRGIELEDGATGRAIVDILQTSTNWSRIRLTLTEGRKREVKQLCKKVGHPVQQLTRVEFANITCGSLRVGGWRVLSQGEISSLHKLVGL